MTLYEAVGGEPAVNAAVDLFYDKVMADPLLAPFFEGVEMGAQNRKQKAFFTTIFKGETRGADAYMRKAHAGLVEERGLSDAHFDAVAKHLLATLEDLKLPNGLIGQIMGAAAGLRDAVLNR
ncbi:MULTISPECIES: group I truncated hemoglobin [Kordiimonas]|uniref:group I truncated hemoglobin n=1 Tax=Kordiimonas TaxID=288021 RepID=UPI0025811DF8|nr:group 1 truncated hemoglobin [Kordiimonas sp. UBA4487]